MRYRNLQQNYCTNLVISPIERQSLVTTNGILFNDCSFPKTFRISKFLKDLRLTVNHLIIQKFDLSSKENLLGLNNLSNFSIISTNHVNFDRLFQKSYEDILQYLPNLEVLHIENMIADEIPLNFFSYSSKLRKEQFIGLKNLLHLKLILYGKMHIEDGIFDNLTSLKTLDIYYNVLNQLPQGSFRNLTNLKTICVFVTDNVRFYRDEPESNDGKLFELSNKLFTNLKSLKIISLRFENSMELTNNTFADNFGQLQNLSITGYKLDTLPSGIFDETRNLKVLQITHSNLTTLPPNIFKNLRNLEFLDLSYNKLKRLES